MHRRAIILLTLLLALAALPAAGQYRRPEPRKTPRALAVLELDKEGVSRLYPVMIMVESKFYDASLYQSKPAPMALWSETVYEGQKSGMPMGLYTVDSALRLQNLWWGAGRWKPFASSGDSKKPAKKPDAAKDAKNDAKPEAQQKTPPKPKDDSDDDRPVLKKPATEAPPPAEKPAPPQTARSSSTPEDADRPTLRRGKPPEGSQVKDTEPFQILDPAKSRPLFDAVDTYMAISDAGPSDSRPYDMQLSPDEQQNYGDQLNKLAWAEIRKFASGRATIPSNAVFSNVRIRSLDLDYSNNPLFVFTAEYKTALDVKLASGSSAQKPLTYFVTFVGRGDMNGQVMKIYATATDTMHLDAYARLEFIDAVDADGDSRGELVFRQIDDIGRKYVVYRGSPYWTKMFEGASGQ